MYVCPQIQNKSWPTPIFVTWAILTWNIDLTEWLRLQDYMHAPSSKPGQVTHVTDYLLLPSARLDSVVKAARYMNALGSNPRQVMWLSVYPFFAPPKGQSPEESTISTSGPVKLTGAWGPFPNPVG